MNREIKRRMKRDQESSDKMTRMRPTPPPPGARRDRMKIRQFLREVQIELRRVIWPTRSEVVTYSIVVLVVVVVLTGVVFLMDLGFAKVVFQLFQPAVKSAVSTGAP